MSNYEKALKLVKDYNKNPNDFTTEQASKISQIAFKFDIKFKPPSKVVEKMFFEFADTALLGMLPNEWRPKRVGEDLRGESMGGQIAGGVGSVAGLVAPVGLGMKVFQGLRGLRMGDKAKNTFAKGAVWQSAQKRRQSLMDKVRDPLRMRDIDFSGIGR